MRFIRRRHKFIAIDLESETVEPLPAPPRGRPQTHYARLCRWYTWEGRPFFVLVYAPTAGNLWHGTAHLEDHSVILSVREQTGPFDGYGEDQADILALHAADMIRSGKFEPANIGSARQIPDYDRTLHYDETDWPTITIPDYLPESTD